MSRQFLPNHTADHVSPGGHRDGLEMVLTEDLESRSSGVRHFNVRATEGCVFGKALIRLALIDIEPTQACTRVVLEKARAAVSWPA